MLELIKKTMLTGVGMAVMTKDKVEELARELAKEGNIPEKEGKELVDELLKKSEQAKKDLETNMEGIVQKVLGKLNLITKEDLTRLEERIKHLEQKDAAEE